MNERLTPSTALLLTVPPLLWASNAIAGRMLRDAVPPMTLNLLRWSIALLILLAISRRLDPLRNWRRLSVLGLFGIGLYNSLQYLALHTSTPINVTLVAAGMPVWMLLVGTMFFGVHATRNEVIGAVISIAGVLLVLSRGSWQQMLELRLVPGDLYMMLATIAWAFYTWFLTQPKDPPGVRSDWAAFLMAQVAYGVLWSSLFATIEWRVTDAHIHWSWPVAGGLLYVATGPAVIAYRCWGAGVARVGPSIAAFFSNLTPLFAALLSASLLGEPPHLFHLAAFVLIVAGIVLSSRRKA
ncbi:MAG: DMT family transporter [Pseudomonadota bacterium]